ncbi:MAG: methyltransferase domain-containing protein, partial [Actinobacteria bacterium]|nr:methyltransferase domain-containing protein [Actinomycetota bacterium]
MDISESLILNIQQRYSEESKNTCNLSCGSNLDLLEIEEGENILDLGCGRGIETMQAAMLTGQGGSAAGLDITQAMVDEALAVSEGVGIGNTRFITGDIESLPFEDGFFDAAMSNCVINHAKDKRKVYSEIFRVLKSWGRFVISDAVTKYPLPEEIKNDRKAWSQCFGGAVTEEEYLEAIKLAGFENVEILKRREYLKNGYDFISLT